jgi:hypothetical protein
MVYLVWFIVLPRVLDWWDKRKVKTQRAARIGGYEDQANSSGSGRRQHVD